MKKKRLLLIASFPLAVVVIIVVLAMLPPGAGVTKANFDRIYCGMKKAEVEEILGSEGMEPIARAGAIRSPFGGKRADIREWKSDETMDTSR